MACWCICNLEDGNVVVDFSAMFLSNAFGYPNYVATFLLFKFQIRIKYTKVELLHKSVHVQLNLEIMN